MELASMLGGDRFSDHPRSVSPVIAAFLRKYNDGLDDIRRQDLCRLAAAAVGTRTTPEAEARRAEMARVWTRRRRPRRRALSRLPSRLSEAFATLEDAGLAAARVALKLVASGQPGAHEAAVRLVDELIRLGDVEEPGPTVERRRKPVGPPDGASRWAPYVQARPDPEAGELPARSSASRSNAP